MLTAMLAFAAGAALVTITPGLDTVLVLRTTVSSGRRAGLLAGLGVNLGCLTWATASAVGLTALLATSRFAFDALRIAGACYLCWLGARAIWTSRRTAAAPTQGPDETMSGMSGGTALRQGLVTNLLNPKVGLLYMSLLPQFIPDGAPILWTSLLFAAIHNIESMLWFTIIILAAGAAHSTLIRPAIKRRVQQLTGIAFIGFGLRLALGD
jgi:threonine/homoserine/homoserine lactone efflux protein